MLTPRVNITITGTNNTYMFNFVHKLSVQTSLDTFIDTATVHMPNQLRYKNKEIINEIKRGDKITIDFGYKNDEPVHFEGYITRVTPDETMILQCEDEGYQAKRIKLQNKVYKTVSLDTLISEQYNGEYVINGDVPDLGTIKIERNPNFVELLNLLKTVYGTTSYWRNGILNIQPVITVGNKTTIFRNNFNIINNSNLTYINEDGYNVVSEVVSLLDDNTKIVWYAFYVDGVKQTSKEAPSGVVSTLRVPNLSEAQAKQWALDRLDNLVYTGYSGSFTAMGRPAVVHSDLVRIEDTRIKDRDGNYMITAVEYTFGVDGFRQTITIKYKQ